MKIMHIVPHIDQEASGPSYSVPRLCESMAQDGHRVVLSCLRSAGVSESVEIRCHAQSRFFPSFSISPDFVSALWRSSTTMDVIHNHSLWSMVNVAAGMVPIRKGAILVTSPRGTLSPYALRRRETVKKVLWFFQQHAVHGASLLHATSEQEYLDIRAFGIRQPVAIVANGIDSPSEAPTRISHDGSMTLLYLGRLHPIKAIDRLLEAWRMVQFRHPKWRLVIAGTGELEYVASLKALSRQLFLERVTFTGPKYGKEKAYAYLSANLFVLPTHSENFGMVIAEALGYGVPVIVSKGAPWQDVDNVGCGWWTNNAVTDLASALDRAMALDLEHLRGMGSKGRDWIKSQFDWKTKAANLLTAYQWVRHGGAPPDWVRLD